MGTAPDAIRRCACGTRLARDNTAIRCTRCQGQARDTPVPTVPDSFWGEPAMREALDSWHMGRVIAAYRLHPYHLQPQSQEMVANWAGTTQARLSRIENGPAPQDLGKLIGWAQLLRIPAALLWFKLPDQPEVALSHATVPHLGALADAAARQSLLFADRAAEANVTTEALEHLRWDIARLATMYVHEPVRSLLGDLVATRDQLIGLLDRRQQPSHGRDLYFLAGTACLLLAHASQNIGNARAALTQLRAAATCANVADHDGLRAWTRGTAALFGEWSLQHAAAADLAAHAAELAPSRESRIRSAAVEARAAARLGAQDRAMTAIDRIRDAQNATAPDVDELTAFGGVLAFPAAKLDFYLGSTYSLLGNHHLAERHAVTAITAYETGPAVERSYGDEALARLDVVNARLARTDLDGASEALAPVLALPAERRITQLHTALDRTRTLLLQPALSRTPLQTELTEALREYESAGRHRPEPLTAG